MNILLATISLMIAIIMLAGLPLDWLMAAQNGAGSIATMVSPARTVLAATTAEIVGKEGQIVRKVGPLVLAAVVVIMRIYFSYRRTYLSLACLAG